MSGNPFSDLTDTLHDRKQREKDVRRQKWAAFRLSLGATVLIAVAAGVGAACGSWFAERDAGKALDRIWGGTVCGLTGGVVSLLAALWHLTRGSVISDALGTGEGTDAGATLFWSTAAGTALFGCVGAAHGLMGAGALGQEVWGGAIVSTLLALIAAVVLRRSARRKTWTGSGSAGYRTGTRD